MNQLGSATSPYLLQHKDNPVDWWEWSAEAFEEARRRDVPVLISVGYAACHWCHVMAHESFEDDGVAALVNGDFVAIKVDREERPDVDAVYMTATTALTGQGGWPMTVFATPSGEPFYAGTYYPRAAFTQLLGAVTDAWRDQRSQVIDQAGQLRDAVAGLHAAAVPGAPVGADLLDVAADALAAKFDEVHGGFGGAPKFPPHMTMLFLLRHYQRTGSVQSLEMVRHTAEQMARGGLYDQLAGGFARYSVDARWIVPHFEKMLYDNALLLRAYTLIWRLTGDELAQRVARGVASFLLDELGTPQGAFAASLDADTEGVEGATYAWTPAQLRDVLGDEDGAFAADLFGVTIAGTFEHGSSVLRLMRDLDGAEAPIRARAAVVTAVLREARARRAQPGRDDKVVAAWNGLTITGLVELAQLLTALGDDRAAAAIGDAAVRAARFLADHHVTGGRLRRVSRDGVVGEPQGVLDDYGCVAEAFCAMHQLTGQGEWLALAGGLLDTALAHFADADGKFYDTADFAEALVARPSDPTDNATPAGVSVLAAALTSYTALTGETRYREAAETALATTAGVLAEHPRYAGYAGAVAEAQLSGPVEIAIVDPTGGSELTAVAVRLAPPGAVVVRGDQDQPGVPLLAGRAMLAGQPTAYLCRGFVCELPVTEGRSLEAQLIGA